LMKQVTPKKSGAVLNLFERLPSKEGTMREFYPIKMDGLPVDLIS